MARVDNEGVPNRTRITHARALEIQEDLIGWLRSSRAREFFFGETAWINSPNGAIDPRSLLVYKSDYELLGETRRLIELQAMEACVPTFCTKEFGEVVEQMSADSPPDAMIVEDVPEASGLLVFEEPLTITPRLEVDENFVLHARAVSWYTIHEAIEGVSTDWIQGRAWTEMKPSEPNDAAERLVEGRIKLYCTGRSSSALTGGRNRHADYASIRTLRTAFALMNTKSARSEVLHRDAKAHPRTIRSTSDDIRRIYIRHPQSVTSEPMDREVAEVTGRAPVRLHWVHWYWQHHWYPKERVHRWILIDDYVRGHPEEGWANKRPIRIADD